MTRREPINPTDDAARALVRDLLADVRFGALAVLHPETGAPYVARVGMIWDDTAALTLVSTLSTHTRALLVQPACAVLVGEVGDKGDPLTHPRLTLTAQAAQVDKQAHKDRWLAAVPKARLYYDFTDFLMFRLTPVGIDLNGGFGKAYRLTPDEL
ncbi:HugZ family pyridoxamine 5'-phosphate oxidase [Yoonia vestfoldensis]|uniref:HugZ family pyridoxamine 5'-phosphate oxidase n=1 Tax=Yoonia vestfoldensis TaxID=245188 RepID=UPI000375B9B7|nr:pyridoxamine 5'-phosphate oxidase family protein [Yoonia vestfoldensis]